MTTRSITIIAVLVLFFCEGIAQIATDETPDTLRTYQIDEVVISGTRTARKIIDIPYSVERIEGSAYRFERNVAVDDVLGSIPGLFLQSRYGNHDVRISIRGFGSRSNSGIRGVRILLDGMPESEPDGQTRIEAIDFQSIGAIEVVKGNASSLYTNAPGGVISFMNDIMFSRSFAINFNGIGSFGLKTNGVKMGIRTKDSRFLLTYNYHTARGYRQHSEDYWHILNSVFETALGDASRLSIYGYYVDGLIRLPGSITRSQFEADPYQPNARDVSRDAKRLTTKGRLGIQYSTYFDNDRTTQLELTTYGTIKYFERTARTYRLMDRYGLGASGRFIVRMDILSRPNEFSVGGDMFHQTGPIQEFNNINGKKGDILIGLTHETIGNVGMYFQNTLTVVRNKLDFLLTGRYDKVIFDQTNQILEVQNDTRRFEHFTPKAALNYKITPMVAAYTSFGFSFDSPAANELDNYPTSSRPTSLINPDLKAQKSRNFELGIKGNVLQSEARLFRNIFFDVTLFRSIIEDEIVPFEVFGDVFYRNSAQTIRRGLEAGTRIEILPGLRWHSAYTFSDFVYDVYAARTVELDTAGNIESIDRSFEGNDVPSVPRHNLAVSLSYERTLGRIITAFLKENFIYVTGMYVDDANSERSTDYAIFNTTIGVDITVGQASILVSAGLHNMFDRTQEAFININSTSKDFYEAGEPRNFFAGLNLGYSL